MSERSESLAGQFEQVNGMMIAAVEQCSALDWRKLCAGEERTVGVLAHHAATSHLGVMSLIQLITAGQPLPELSEDMLNQGNARHAIEHADCTPEEVLGLLQSNGATAAAYVRSLSDKQLDSLTSLFGEQRSAQEVIEYLLIGHVYEHLRSMQEATGPA
jgi:hypothetical protein